MAEVEGAVRSVLRGADAVQRQALIWASRLMSLLPERLPLIDAEMELLKLFLAQQRRLNLELDSRRGFLARIACRWPFHHPEGQGATTNAAHKLAASYIEQAIKDTADRFCGQHGLSPASSAVLDWRVALRYMAQQLHRAASGINLRHQHYLVAPLQRKLAGIATPLAGEVAFKRAQLLDRLETAASS